MYLISGRSFKMNYYTKIPIGIKSCEGYSERQNACRNTWIDSLDKDKYLPLFLVGRKNQPSEIVGDILYLDCGDGYDTLIEKTTAFIKWYTNNVTSSHCILCDDDTYINCNIFNSFEEYKQYDYSGCFIYGMEKVPNPNGGYYGGYCSGCFYTLSKKAADHYLKEYDPSMVSNVFHEDLCTGNLINTDPNLTKFDPTTIHAWSYCTYLPTLMVGHYVHKGEGSLPSFTDSMQKMHNFYYKIKQKAVSDTGWWSSELDHMIHVTSQELSKWICEFLKEEKDIPLRDFGCGLGIYLKNLKEFGYSGELTGFEGDPPKNKVFDNIIKHDLTIPIELLSKGNVISLEVGEHIPAEFMSIYLDNICNACNHYLIVSWAIRGQGGQAHVNELDNYEIIAEFEKRGFRLMVEPTKEARNIYLNEAPWFRNTLLIFMRETTQRPIKRIIEYIYND